MRDGAKVFLVLAILVLAVFAIIYVPLFNIWALNTLFGLSIPWTLKTWLAAVLLTLLFTPGRYVKK